MYKLVITTGAGPSRKVESKGFWMTQQGLHSAEEEFETAKIRQDVSAIVLWRQDIHGTYELKRWDRKCRDGG